MERPFHSGRSLQFEESQRHISLPNERNHHPDNRPSNRQRNRSVIRSVVSMLPLLAFCLSTMILPSPIRAQPSGSVDPAGEGEIERLLEEQNREEEPDPELIDLLEEYRRHPIPLQTATVDQLSALPGISPQSAQRILDFVAAESPESFDRFSEIADMEESTIAILRHYTTLNDDGVTESAAGKEGKFGITFRSRLVQDIQERRGYSDKLQRLLIRREEITGDSVGIDTIALGPRYLGGSSGILTRLLLEYDRFSAGITFEKDPGEPLFYHDTTGFSYADGELVDRGEPTTGEVRRGIGSFVSLHAKAELKPATIYLGDFTAEFGQGLLFGESFAGRKGSAPTRDPYRGERGLRSYRSSGEANYFRGIGVDLHAGEWTPSWLSGSFFLSSRVLDGSVGEQLSSEGDSLRTVTSIKTDGYLRTRSEIRRNDVVTEKVVGMHATARFGDGSIGVTAYHLNYSLPIEAASKKTPPYTEQNLASIDGTYPFNNGRGFGEFALSERGGVSGVAGVALQLPRGEVTISGRYYGAEFNSPHGVAFGESPATSRNEIGLYAGVRVPLFPRTFLSFYGDLYRFPEESATVPFSISGVDGMALFDCGVTRDLRLSVRLRSERRGDVVSTEDEFSRSIPRAVDRTIAGLRLDGTWRPKNGPIELRVRLEETIARYSDLLPGADGFLTYLDCRWKPLSNLAFGSRLVLFSAESADVQLREFEQDVPGRLTLTPLSGEGRRFYILARWQPLPRTAPQFALTARYSETWYADGRPSISPGSLQQIDEALNNQVVVQVDWGM